MAGLESSDGSGKEYRDKSRESQDYDANDKARLITEKARIDAKKTLLEADMEAEKAAIRAEERQLEVGEAAVEAAERWRTRNRQRFAYIDGIIKKEVTKNARKDAEHDQRIGQQEEELKNQKAKQEALHNRVDQIEISHIHHGDRIELLEQRRSDHAAALKQISGQNKWVVPVAVTLGITGGLIGLVWMISKFIGKKKDGKDSRKPFEAKAKNARARAHARAWKIAPEINKNPSGMNC